MNIQVAWSDLSDLRGWARHDVLWWTVDGGLKVIDDPAQLGLDWPPKPHKKLESSQIHAMVVELFRRRKEGRGVGCSDVGRLVLKEVRIISSACANYHLAHPLED